MVEWVVQGRGSWKGGEGRRKRGCYGNYMGEGVNGNDNNYNYIIINNVEELGRRRRRVVMEGCVPFLGKLMLYGK